MKNFGIIHILFLIIAMIAYQCAGAQDYVVHIKGDTLKGDVKLFTIGAEKKVQVTQNKKKTSYPIFQVRSVHYKDDVYHPVKRSGGYVFMKSIKSGYLSLYAFQNENQVAYDGFFLVKKDGTSIEVPNLGFKKAMKNFLEECPMVVSRLDEGDLSKRDLPQMVEEFNACIDQNSIKHAKTVAITTEQTKKINSWDVLLQKLKEENDFEGKADAVDMIGEIKMKISKSEKIPNFMIEGLKGSLRGTSLQNELATALSDIQ